MYFYRFYQSNISRNDSSMKFFCACYLVFLELKNSLALLLVCHQENWKVINKHNNSDNNGSRSNDNIDVKDYGHSYGDSYSNHHKV